MIDLIDIWQTDKWFTFKNPKPGLGGLTITGISIDTRTLKKDDVYFAIKGENFDGHDFIMDAYKKGASLCVMNEDWYEKNKKNLDPYYTLSVADTTLSLGYTANHFKKKYNIPF